MFTMYMKSLQIKVYDDKCALLIEKQATYYSEKNKVLLNIAYV